MIKRLSSSFVSMRYFLFLLLIHNFVFATTIYGDIYDGDTLDQLQDVLITITDENDNVVVQKMFEESYSLDVGEGNYTLRAYHFRNGSLALYSERAFEAKTDDVGIDLVLIPYELQALVPGFTAPPIPAETAGMDGGAAPIPFLEAGLVLLGVAALAAIYLLYPKKKTDKKERADSLATEVENPTELDGDCKAVMKILGENEGRMVQKELRDILKWSEAKMSLVVSELEMDGHVRKIRKGRENIIKLANR